MSRYRTTFYRRAGRSAPPEVIGAADFDSLDAATAAGRAWADEDLALNTFEVALLVVPEN